MMSEQVASVAGCAEREDLIEDAVLRASQSTRGKGGTHVKKRESLVKRSKSLTERAGIEDEADDIWDLSNVMQANEN
jgi:hypothetical protein